MAHRSKQSIMNISSDESVRVMVRFRPINKREKAEANNDAHWKKLQDTDKGLLIKRETNQLSLYNILEKTNLKDTIFKRKSDKFIFDEVMDEKTSQSEAFENVAQQICDEIIEGFNGTVFVYGQTGSGKTHTMYGPEEHKNSSDITKMGVIPQAVAYIFSILNNPLHPLVEGMLGSKVQVEFIEIYNEKVYDLLDKTAKVSIHEIPYEGDWKVVVKNVQRKQINGLEDFLDLNKTACKHRTVRGTNQNKTSSRSHMILRIIVDITTADGIRTGIGNFADLAGSERVKKTGVKGMGIKEAGNIMKGLFNLKEVINELEAQKKHVGFKNSKLTYVLKNSLGGNCKTTLCIAASPHVFNRGETIRALKFGEQCRKIQNKAKKNMQYSKAQLLEENERLKERIKELENNKVGSGEIMDEKQKEMEKENITLIEALQLLKDEKEKLLLDIVALKQMKTENEKEIEQWMDKNEKLDGENKSLKEKYNDLSNRSTDAMKEKDGVIDTLNVGMGTLKQNEEVLRKENADLVEQRKNLQEMNESMDVQYQRLSKTNSKQNDAIKRLEDDYTSMEQERIKLHESFLAQMESNKDQFSEKEMKMSQTIHELQSEMDQKTNLMNHLKGSLHSKEDMIREQQQTIDKLEDNNRRTGSELNGEKNRNSELNEANKNMNERNDSLNDENKRLISEMEQLELLLTEQKQQFMLQMETLKECHDKELNERDIKYNDLEIEIEKRSNEVEEEKAINSKLKESHEEQINNLKYEMEELEKENRTAIGAIDDFKEMEQEHKRQITTQQQENEIIAEQCGALESRFDNIIQAQIQQDEQLAIKTQNEERLIYIEMIREQQRLKPQNWKSFVNEEEEEEEELLGGMGATKGLLPHEIGYIDEDDLSENDEEEESTDDSMEQEQRWKSEIIKRMKKKKEKKLREQREKEEAEEKKMDYVKADDIMIDNGDENEYCEYNTKKKPTTNKNKKKQKSDEQNDDYDGYDDSGSMMIIDDDEEIIPLD